MQRRARTLFLLLLLVGLMVGGCAPQEGFAPTPTKTPSAPVVEREAVATEPPAQGEAAVEAMSAAPAAEETLIVAVPAATETPPPAPNEGGGSMEASLPNDAPVESGAVVPYDHYWMQRPIGPEYRNYLDRTYPYGSTSGGR